jgi:hypothetical protein
MAEPGWYPDPEGAPGRYRYWDGRRWSAESVEEPQDDPLFAAAAGGGPTTGDQDGRRRQRRTGLVILGVLVVVALVVAGVWVLVRPGGSAVSDPNPPAPSVTGWDDTSPTASAAPSPSSSPTTSSTSGPTSSPTAAGSLTPSQSAATIARPAAHCPAGEPTQSVQHPDDGRVHGGDLSFDPVSGAGFGSPKVDDTLGWWYDEHAQLADAGSGRTARIAVGTVAIQSGFKTPAEAARSSVLCAIRTGDYSDYAGHHTVRNGAITVDGQQAAEFVADVERARPAGAGDRITVVVVNAGPPGSYSIFLASSPLGDSKRAMIVSTALKSLKVDD